MITIFLTFVKGSLGYEMLEILNTIVSVFVRV